MNRFWLPFLYTLFILIYSCSTDDSISNSDTIEIIKIDENYINTLHLDSIINSYSIIPLETNSESEIATISRIEYFNERFYISDRDANNLLVFDTNGKLIFKIPSVGRGPDGFYVISSFKIGRNHEVYVLSGDRGIVSFDSTGRYLGTLKFQISPEVVTGAFTALALTGDGEFILWNGSTGINKHNYHDAFYAYRISEMGQIVDNYLPIKFPFWGTHTIFYGKEGNYLMQGLVGNDTIYRADISGINPAYIVDFGPNRIPENLKRQPYESYSRKIYDLETYLNYSGSINSPIETDSYLYFQFKNFDTTRLVFYSNVTSEIITGTFPFMTILGWPKFNCATNTQLVGYIQPHKAYSLDEELKKSFSLMELKIINEILEIDLNNNPALLLIDVKKF
jgi:hypothetical protein